MATIIENEEKGFQRSEQHSKRMKNPTYSLLQHTLVLILVLMTLQVRAIEIEIERNGIRFTIDNATRSASVSGTDNTLATIVIPSAIEHGGVRYPVTDIADYALAFCQEHHPYIGISKPSQHKQSGCTSHIL